MPIKSQERTALILLVAVISLSLSSASLGFPNQSGDSSSGYGGCAVSGCHLGAGAAGNGTVEMWASNMTILVNQEIDVYVNITEWVLSANMKVGVFLLKSLTADDSDVPSADGWIIIQDPNGNENNYVQKIANASGETLVFRWHIRGPFSAGTYTLYARVHHGGGGPYWEENSTGLTFQVLPDVSVTPDLVLKEVFIIGQPTVGEEAVLYATVFSDSSEGIEGVRVDFFVDGEAVAERHNQTFAAMRFRNTTATWIPSAPGNHTLRVVVDLLNQTEESDETNNELTIVFEVSKAEPRRTPGFEAVSLLAATILAIVPFLIRRGGKHETR
ncbi:MAG: CARDB domain-containing protein [Thermoplasmata archaeon]